MIPTSIAGIADPVSSLSHFFAAALALLGGYALYLRGHGNSKRMASLFVFTFSLVFLFTMSACYHLLHRGGLPRMILQRLDHAGIWLVIAGTFTPVQIILFRGAERWTTLKIVWLLAITGLFFELAFFDSIPEWLLVFCFTILAILGGGTARRFKRNFKGASIRNLVLGWVFYGIGAACELSHGPILINGVLGPHELLHLFVILGALQHWLFVYKWSHHSTENEITFYVSRLADGRLTAVAANESMAVEAQSVSELKKCLKQKILARFHSGLCPVVRLRHYVEESLKW